jgi:hypothetical protein
LAEKTGVRLDTVDIADGSGWQVDSTHEVDVFTKGAVTIEVRYFASDDIESAVKRSARSDLDRIGRETTDAVERLRSWLTGRPSNSGDLPFQRAGGTRADFTTDPGGWTREDLIAAVQDPVGRAFLLRILELMDANSQFPAEGQHSRLHFGKQPGGAVFFYPFGRRFPPFKLAVKAGELMISGCWKGNFKATGHPGFADLASMLGQDERGSAGAVSVAGLDPDELWAVAENVSRAIN